MAAILRASNALWLPGQKPGGALAIDWSNPLSNGLIDYLLFNDDGIPANLATPSAVTAFTGNPALVSTAMGAARYCTGGTDVEIPNHVNYSAGAFTVRILFLPVSWPANFTALIDKGISGGSGREFSYFIDASGNIDFVSIGGGGGSTVASTGFTPGSIWDFASSRAVGGTQIVNYVNGLSLGSPATAQAGTTANAAVLSFGLNTTTGGVNADAKYILVSIWLRQLSDSEIAYLYLNPFAMLTTTDGELPELLPTGVLPMMGQIWI